MITSSSEASSLDEKSSKHLIVLLGRKGQISDATWFLDRAIEDLRAAPRAAGRSD
jgi:hypothetical protein